MAMDRLDNKLAVHNNADYDIYVVLNFNPSETGFEDSSMNALIEAHTTGHACVMNTKWEEVMETINVLTVYFVTKDSVDKCAYGEWRHNVKPLKKVMVTEAQLDSLNWTLEFP